MSFPRLTICVPTFNRSANLDLLLRRLAVELRPFANEVVVYVSDNASTDDTATVIERIKVEWPGMVYYRHPENIGAERNFIHCMKQIRTQWFWFIGDDDLPKSGVFIQILALLKERQPALIYLRSKWVMHVQSQYNGQPVGTLRVSNLDALSFAKAVNIWVTYISGMVIDHKRLELVLQGQSIDRFDGTSLVQLGWVLPMLKTQGPFLYVNSDCILSLASNTSGYNLLKVFGNNYQKIIKESFYCKKNLEHLGRAMIVRGHIHHLPGLIRGYVRGTNGNFEKNLDMNSAFDNELTKTLFYRYILKPIYRNSIVTSVFSYIVAILLSKIISLYDKLVQSISPKCSNID